MRHASLHRPGCTASSSAGPLLGRGAIVLATLLSLVALSGCGRKGPLELPEAPPPTQDQAAAAQAKQARVLQNTDTPGLIQSPNQVIQETAEAKQQVFKAAPAPRAINAPPVDRPTRFVLDPLL